MSDRCGSTMHGFECVLPKGHNMGKPDIPENHQATKAWEIFDDEEAAAIANFGGIAVEKVRGIEMLVLLKMGKVRVT